MFGQDNQNDQNQQDGVTPVISPAPDALLNDDDTNPSADAATPAAPASGAPVFDTSGVSLNQPVEDSAASDTGNSTLSDSSSPVSSPSDNTDDTATDQVDSPASSAPATSGSSDDDHLLTSGPDDDLIHIKQDALQQLSPLVNHLDQTPEEKFRTTMMMIQASDDQSLVKAAYEAARDIKDDKVRAQALLDIINEINYFTQQNTTTE